MLRRHARRAQHGLQLRDVESEHGHAKSKQDGGEEQRVLGLLVEGRRMLEDAQTAGAKRHEVEPLPMVEVSILFRRVPVT